MVRYPVPRVPGVEVLFNTRQNILVKRNKTFTSYSSGFFNSLNGYSVSFTQSSIRDTKNLGSVLGVCGV